MFPAEITTNYIISQVIGLIAICVDITSYLVKTKKKQLICIIISNIFISASFLFLGTYAACIGIVIATIRTIIFFLYELKLKQVPVWVISIIFMVLIANSAVLMNSLWDLLPMFSLMLFTLSFRVRKVVYMRLCFIIPMLMFFAYDLYIYAYTDIMLKIIELTIIGINTTRFLVRKANLERVRAIEEMQGEMEELSDE